MKNLISRKPTMAGGLLKSMCVALILSACADEPEVVPVRPPAESSSVENSRESADGRLACRPSGPNYNLNVFLHAATKGWAFGFIKFRQNIGETQMIHLDTWVHDLEPNTSYLLQRAVDNVTLDYNCTSTAWLTLGKGLDPQAIVTDKHGNGRAELFRSVATVPVGSTFDIHFQIIKESTSEVVLASDCYQYTVR